MPSWIILIASFLLGSIPFGLIIAKSKGINIREHGSGNIGATNVLRVVGKKYGISCFILDFFKGFTPTVIAAAVFLIEGEQPLIAIPALESFATTYTADQRSLAQTLIILTGLLSILGHNYSPWVGFKGGKGIATSAGVLVGLLPWPAITILVLVWVILFFTTKYVSVASIGAAISVPIVCIYGSYAHGKIADGTWNIPLFIFALVIAALATWRHKSNIQNLINGTEHRFGSKKK
ncbi:glycerol-3-phosphate 1-O-acyltransferase PlsY [Persicirhabdus sediminis]|uniref:Glycerol-3-phosphate acyltransferase n=1 Tax=Persicirhabdus sediminis TaxID=454144 RepID=A0A8J7SGK1_9BACT|nr:glycerol-3-phosphate 1-O-acyltransferase PlsY [Persicirhabdus sediminis]MBK1790170.1 glycerol-3-phosphate 1-O-acyltransferase PlsY [Persicirhabdus sediminis]